MRTILTILLLLISSAGLNGQSLSSPPVNTTTVSDQINRSRVGDVLFGNSGSNPYIGGNGDVPFSLRANGREFLRGFDAGSGLMRTWGRYTTDPSSTPWFNNGHFIIGAHGYNNAIIGFVSNDLPPSTMAFPTGITGIAYNKGAGNTAFGIYGEGHATTAGIAIGAEVAAFQDGNPAPSALPFDNTIGTSQTVAKGIQLTAGSSTKSTFTGVTSSGSATITALSSTSGLTVGQLIEGAAIPWGATISGINRDESSMVISGAALANEIGAKLTAVSPAGVASEVGREGSTSGVFQTAHFVQKDATLNWSYYQDADATKAPRSGMFIGHSGQGVGLVLQHAMNINPGNGVFTINDASGTSVANIRQNGQAFFGNASQSGSMLILHNNAGTCTLTPTPTTASFSCSSDERLKENIKDARSAIDWLGDFRVREYDVKATREHVVGVVAQEVQKTHPEMVRKGNDGMLSIEAPNPWLLLKAIQEQQSQIFWLQVWCVALSSIAITLTAIVLTSLLNRSAAH